MSQTLRSWSPVLALAALVIAQPFVGCGDPAEPNDQLPPTEQAAADLLAAVGPEVVLPAVDTFRASLLDLRAAVDDWKAALGSGEEQAALEAAREAWNTTMSDWQVLELMQLGPAAPALTAIGGRDLRDRVYSWPAVNRCRVDQLTVGTEWEGETFFADNLVNVQGLDALEVLLFAPTSTNGCPAFTEPNSSGAWTDLGDAGISAQRAGFAAAMVHELQRAADELHAAWSTTGDDFSTQLATAGEPSSPYASRTEALNAVYRALFYLELSTKDVKLARPLGLTGDCVDEACLSLTESPFARGSHRWLHQNVRGFRALFTGGEGAGLDDLVRELGQGPLVDEILTALDAAEQTLTALDTPLDELATDDPATVQAAHDAVKAVTDLLKNDLATVLLLQVPSEAAGDND
jgi:predicted lipoprotein